MVLSKRGVRASRLAFVATFTRACFWNVYSNRNLHKNDADIKQYRRYILTLSSNMQWNNNIITGQQNKGWKNKWSPVL